MSEDAGLRAELKAEYLLLQTHYEAYDSRALLIKALSAPVLAAGMGVGASLDGFGALFFLALAATLCLWALEGFSKIYQRAFDARIEAIEEWFADPDARLPAPFQTLTSWRASFEEAKGDLLPDLAAFLMKPAVAVPYAPLAAVGCITYLVVRLG